MYGTSQTPRGAPTPFVSGMGMDDDEVGGSVAEKGKPLQSKGSVYLVLTNLFSTELPSDWLMTFPENVLVGAMLEFCVPEGESIGYSDGAYDGQVGVFVTRLDSGARYTRTVTVKLLQDGKSLGGVPFQYLTPVRPKPDEHAVCLDRSHSSFGKTAVLSSKDGEECMLEVFDANMGNPDMEFLKYNMIVKKHME